MVGKIFLNYRRGDDAGSVGRLFDRLEQAFGRDAIFMDVEGHIKAGDDYVDVLRDQVAECDVLLVVIGPRWLTLADETGRRRLDNPDDWVRVEIVSALEAAPKKRVVPVLVPGGEMPRAEDLPVPLQPLARRQAVRVTLERFNADAQGLISQVKAVLYDIARQNASSDADRAAAEKELRGREASENARLAAVEERGREQRASGMSADDVRKAEELASWDFIKTRKDLEELRDHLARFPGGATERYAQARLAELTYAGLSAWSPPEALQAYIETFPQAQQIAQVRDWLNVAETRLQKEVVANERRAKESAAWAAIAARADEQELQAFLREWPHGDHAANARARLRELRSGRFHRRSVLKSIAYGVGGTAMVGAVVASSASEPGTPLWRLINDRSLRTFTGHNSGILAVAIAPDGKTALSGSRDQTLKLWDLTSGREVRTFTRHHSEIRSVAIAPDGKTAFSVSRDDTFKLWDLPSGRELRTFSGHRAYVWAVAITPDWKSAISGSSDRTLKLWDLTSGRELRTFTGHRSDVRSIAIAPDGRTALSGSDDNTLKLWDLTSGRELRAFSGHLNGVLAIAIAADGKMAISGSADGTLTLWDLTSGRELRTLSGHFGPVAIASDGKTVLSGSPLKLWDLETGRDLKTFTGHSNIVYSVAIAPDGKTALSGSADNTLKLWDLS